MNIRKKRGLTLIEIVVAIAISSLIFIPVFTMFTSMNNIFTSTDRLAMAQTYTEVAVNKIKTELSKATIATLSNELNSVDGKKYLYTNDGVMYIRKVLGETEEIEIIRKPDLDQNDLKCTLVFSSTGGKAITVAVTILDKTTNEQVYHINTVVYLQNTPYGITVAVSPGVVVEYSVSA